MSKRNVSENDPKTVVCGEFERWKTEFYELMQLWTFSEQHPSLMNDELLPLNKETFKELVKLMHILKSDMDMRPYLDRVKNTLVSNLDKNGVSYKRFRKLYTAIASGRLSTEVLRSQKTKSETDGRRRTFSSETWHELKKFWDKVEEEEWRERTTHNSGVGRRESLNNTNKGCEVIKNVVPCGEGHADPYKTRILDIHSRISRFGTAFRIWATIASIMCVASIVVVFATYRAPEVDPFLSYAAVVAISLCTLVCVVAATALMLTHVLRCRSGYMRFCDEERVRLGLREGDDLPHELVAQGRSYLVLLAARIGIGATTVLLAVAVWTGRMWLQSEWGLPATLTHEMIAGLVGMVFAMFIMTVLSLDCTKVMAADGKVTVSLDNNNTSHCNKLAEQGMNGDRALPQPVRAIRVLECIGKHDGADPCTVRVYPATSFTDKVSTVHIITEEGRDQGRECR